MVIQILGLILIGAVIGVLARLIKPGKQRLSMVATIAPRTANLKTFWARSNA